MKDHPLAAPVPAIPCWGVYADYDANAPNTCDMILVSTEELCDEVLALLNEHPRKWT